MLRVWPNPTNGLVMFESDEVIENIEVYSIAGRLVETIQPQLRFSTLNMQSFPEGTYVVKIANSERHEDGEVGTFTGGINQEPPRFSTFAPNNPSNTNRSATDTTESFVRSPGQRSNELQLQKLQSVCDAVSVRIGECGIASINIDF